MGYRNFIETGVEFQRNSVTVDEATRQFGRSCERCHYHIECERCPIAVAHHEKLEAIISLRQLEHDKKQKNDELKKKLDDIIKQLEDVYAMIYNANQLDEQNDKLDALTDEWLKAKGESNAKVKLS